MDRLNIPADQESEEILRRCREVINGIDSMCQNQLGQIRSIVAAMLRAMETSDFWEHPDTIVKLLGLIQYTADDLMNFVNGSAETVGFHYVDDIGEERDRRVSEAFQKACQAQVDHIARMKSCRAEAHHV